MNDEATTTVAKSKRSRRGGGSHCSLFYYRTAETSHHPSTKCHTTAWTARSIKQPRRLCLERVGGKMALSLSRAVIIVEFIANSS